jgi:hypothetical protein
VALFQQQALQPFTSAGIHVAAFEVVFSQHNVEPRPYYKGYYIKNKLSCQHQDLRDAEPWFDRVRAAVALCLHTVSAVPG